MKYLCMVVLLTFSSHSLALSLTRGNSIDETVFGSGEIFVGTVEKRISIRKYLDGRKGAATRIVFKDVFLINEKGLDKNSENKHIEIPGGLSIDNLNDDEFNEITKNKDQDELSYQLQSEGISYSRSIHFSGEIEFELGTTYIVMLGKDKSEKSFIPLASITNGYFILKDGYVYTKRNTPLFLTAPNSVRESHYVFDETAVENKRMIEMAAAQGDTIRDFTGAKKVLESNVQYVTLDDFVNYVNLVKE